MQKDLRIQKIAVRFLPFPRYHPGQEEIRTHRLEYCLLVYQLRPHGLQKTTEDAPRLVRIDPLQSVELPWS